MPSDSPSNTPRQAGSPPGSKKAPLDPWKEIAHEFPHLDKEGLPIDDRVGLFEGIKRFFVLLFWRPISAIAYFLGMLYGCECIYLFGRGHFLEPYGLSDGNQLSISELTPVVRPDGLYLILIWLTVPPVWFFIEGYVLCKTPQQRVAVVEAQQISIKTWLAMLGVMAILAK